MSKKRSRRPEEERESAPAPGSAPSPTPDLGAAPPAAQAAPSIRALWGWVELGALVVAAAVSLGFYATLPGRLPADQDYLDVSKAIVEGFHVGDEIATAPEWAERARMLISGYPFLSAPDLTQADFTFVRRLWLIGLPSIPRSDLAEVTRSLSSSLRPSGELRTFGKLTLQLYENPGFKEPLLDFAHDIGSARVWLENRNGVHQDCVRDGDIHHCQGATVGEETREVDFAPVDCIGANVVRPNTPLVVDYPQVMLGDSLLVTAAVTGEMGWRHGPEYTPVYFSISIDGQDSGRIDIPVGTVPLQRTTVNTQSFDKNSPHEVRFTVVSANPKDREFCFNARAY